MTETATTAPASAGDALSVAARARLKVRYVAVAKLVPYTRNARQHPKKQLEQIADSIRRYGFTSPVLIDGERGILAGHGRVKAADMVGLKEVPCIELGHLSEREKREYILADNKLAEGGTWDDALLRLELTDLRSMGTDLKLVGFRASELAKFAPHKREDGGLELPTEKTAIIARPEQPISEWGDVWLLGNHRLLCGDSTRADDVRRVLDGGLAPVVMVTDPPYGVTYDPTWRDRQLKAVSANGQTRTQSLGTGKVQGDTRFDWTAAWHLFPGPVVYVWHGAVATSRVQDSIENAGFEVRSQIVWRKPHFAISRGAYHWQHECAWYAVRIGQSAQWKGARDQSTVWNIDAPVGYHSKHTSAEDARTEHGTQKPVECMARPIVNHTDEGQAVYDPFVGSGATIIAAEQLKRVAYAIDIDPAYVDMAVTRWQNLTGKAAVLAGDGRTFAAIGVARGVTPAPAPEPNEGRGLSPEAVADVRPTPDPAAPAVLGLADAPLELVAEVIEHGADRQFARVAGE